MILQLTFWCTQAHEVDQKKVSCGSDIYHDEID
jgi:hypothetical protein